jgi:hypothetical protein
MKASLFMQLQNMMALVRKYQVRWEFCLDRKTHSYYWLGMLAHRN